MSNNIHLTLKSTLVVHSNLNYTMSGTLWTGIAWLSGNGRNGKQDFEKKWSKTRFKLRLFNAYTASINLWFA